MTAQRQGSSQRFRFIAQARAWARLLVALGTGGYPPDVRRRLQILNMVCYLIAFCTLIYSVQHIFVDYQRYEPVILINLALVFVALAVPFVHRFHEMAGGMLIAVAESIALFVLTAYLGRDSGVQIQYMAFAAAPFVIWGLDRLVWVLGLVATGLGLHLLAWFWFPKGMLDVEADVIDPIYVSASFTTVGIIAATVYYAFRLAERAQAETDALLRNVLPASIAERLKAAPDRAISDSFHNVTVMFADLVGFTQLSRHLGAARTVALLNELVSELDRLAVQNGVEKIKTIGDSFMAVCGAPEPREDPEARMACMALETRAAVARLALRHGLDLSVRIGLASGPIMAGVIGTRRFIYDVWGDVVNLAARLEQTGVPGRIQACSSTAEALAGIMICERRGIVEIKGMAPQETWFIEYRELPKEEPGGAALRNQPIHASNAS